jgi:hypothetical protein
MADLPLHRVGYFLVYPKQDEKSTVSLAKKPGQISVKNQYGKEEKSLFPRAVLMYNIT